MKKKVEIIKESKKVNFNLLLIITFFTGVLLIISSYAWFYSSLDVKIDNFKVTVNDEAGLFISLDGINYSNTIEISRDSTVRNLTTYPNHTNQWAPFLIPVSSNGIKDSNSDKFAIYANNRIGKKPGSGSKKKYINTRIMNENIPTDTNLFIAFDIFLKNVTGSPKSDNLYLDEGTTLFPKNEKVRDEDGTINSMRIGILKMGSISRKADIKDIQNLSCNNKCEMIIYEPNSTLHSEESIERALNRNAILVDGEYSPTYAVINEGIYLELASGYEVELDTEHFAMQDTITEEDFVNPIFQIPNGITKFRIYVWLEGQDMDNLEIRPHGAQMTVVINFLKDLAGYY